MYIVDEYWVQGVTVAKAADEIKARDKGWPIEATFVDPAGRSRSDQTGFSDIDVFRSHGIPCRYVLGRFAQEVANGINMVRAALLPGTGEPRLFIAGACKETTRAFESYELRKVNDEYIDEPVKPQACDHPMDAIRYYFVNRQMGKSGGSSQMGIT